MKQIRVILVALMTMVLLLSAMSAFAEETETSSVYSEFLNPDYTAKPMVRMWFADASAGVDDNDVIAKQIQALADAGIGGVEIQFLADSQEMTNEEAQVYGWGTDAFVALLKKVYTAAAEVEGGFTVDITISAHWPIMVNSIDPNDDMASQELVSSITKVTQEALESGNLELSLPEAKYWDTGTSSADNVTDNQAYFLFVSKYISSSLAQVIEINDDNLVLEYASVENLEDSVSVITLDSTDGLSEYDYREIDGVTYAGQPGGIPDEDYLEYFGVEDVTYEDIVSWWGEAPAEDADLAASYNGKTDESFNRARLADWQYLYEFDLSDYQDTITASEGSDIQVGDWVVVTNYHRGTGQTQSGGWNIPLGNRSYVIDYYTEEGINAIIDYWNLYILDDELREMIANSSSGSLFEDSLEVSADGEFWPYDMQETAEEILGSDYEYLDQLSLILGATDGVIASDNMGNVETMDEESDVEGQQGGIETAEAEYTYSLSSATDADAITDLTTRVKADYSAVQEELFATEHCIPANEFAASLGMTYRAQAGTNHDQAAAEVNILEGDNGHKQDGARKLSGIVYMNNDRFVSQEAVTGMLQYEFNWADVLAEVYNNYSHGINRVVLHGSPYSKTLNAYNASWPGWDHMGRDGFGSSYTYREIYWEEDAATLYTQMARIQAVLQYGQAKIDLAMLSSTSSGNTLQNLLDVGYSYSILSEYVLNNSEGASVTDGRLNADGTAYKALLINAMTTLETETAQTLIEYAEGGLPIVFIGSVPDDVEGTIDSAEELQGYLETLFTYDNVYEITEIAELNELLPEIGVESYASYDYSGLEVTLFTDDEDYFYYVYNSASTANSGMMSAQSSLKWKSSDLTDLTITLEGTGTPYVMDPVTGDVTQVGEYTINDDGTVTIVMDSLPGGYAQFIGITNSDEFPEATTYVTAVDADAADYEIVRDEDGALYLRSAVAGTYTITLSDGTETTVTVDESVDVIDLSGELWDLQLDSWGPATSSLESVEVDENGIQLNDPSDGKFTTLELGEISLVSWYELEVSDEDLELLGVDSMDAVSGIGYYTYEIDWDGNLGAYLYFEYGYDEVTGVIVNGYEIQEINNLADVVDIGEYLVDGVNTITIECTSVLRNRATYEMIYDTLGWFSGTYPVPDGITTVVLTPYLDTLIQ